MMATCKFIILIAFRSFVLSSVHISSFSAFVAPRSAFRDIQEKISSHFSREKKASTGLRFKLSDVVDDAESSSLRSSVQVELQSIIEQGPVPAADRNFLINGWRWHTKSVLRDINRFSSIVDETIKNLRITSSASKTKLSKDSTKFQKDQIVNCFNFVINFNWKALMRVEREIFFPWLQELLPYAATPLIEDILTQHKTINKLSNEIGTLCNSLRQDIDSKDIAATEMKLQAVLDNLAQARGCAIAIQRAQESIFVPYIEAFVNKRDQEVFNRRVISRLGLLDAQVHLVSMVEAIKDTPDEMNKFKQQIPRIAQVMIPLWRKRLYLPKTECLNTSI